jgi:hypothetical protein
MTDDLESRIRAAYRGLEPAPDRAERVREAVSEVPQAERVSLRPALGVAAGVAVALVGTATWLATGLGSPDRPGEPPAPRAPAPTTEREREENRAAYAKLVAEAGRGRNGGWIAIADGTVSAWATRAEAAAVAPAARHRFVFEIGPEEHEEDTFVSTWYGPRFAGMALVNALDVNWRVGPSTGTTLTKGSKSTTFGTPPFPRVPVSVAAPGGTPETLDVFLGTVGPPLMLTPDDWQRLGLARWEIPGTHTVMGLPCLRARVRVSFPGLEGDAELVASCPEFGRERLVEFARHRGRFWEWGGTLSQLVTSGRDGKWIVFGVDRVLGEGATAVEALEAADGAAREAYHRFVVRLPRGDALRVDEAWFQADESVIDLNGVETAVRHPAQRVSEAPVDRLREREIGGAASVVLLAGETAARRARIHEFESARDVLLVRGGAEHAARAGYAWRGGGKVPTLVLAVYPVD